MSRRPPLLAPQQRYWMARSRQSLPPYRHLPASLPLSVPDPPVARILQHPAPFPSSASSRTCRMSPASTFYVAAERTRPPLVRQRRPCPSSSEINPSPDTTCANYCPDEPLGTLLPRRLKPPRSVLATRAIPRVRIMVKSTTARPYSTATSLYSQESYRDPILPPLPF